jgi:hypothetical protein
MPDYAPPKSCNEFTFVGDELHVRREKGRSTRFVRTLGDILDGNIQVKP